MHDEAAHALTGKRSHVSYRLTQAVEVRLVEAAPMTGGLLFAIEAAAAGFPPSRDGIAPGRGPLPARDPGCRVIHAWS